MAELQVGEQVLLDRKGLDALLQALRRARYRVVGPTLRDQAVVYDEVRSIKDLPEGWTDEQEGGIYRLKKRDDAALFGYIISPHSWKQFLFPPRQKLWEADRKGRGMAITPNEEDAPRYALLGVRACELHAICIQDKVFLEGPYVDPIYKAHRERAFIIAVQCTQAGNTCFCVSMNSGPKAESGFDLALTEIVQKTTSHFVVEVGSDAGARLLSRVPVKKAKAADTEKAAQARDNAVQQMGRSMKSDDLRELLQNNYEHPRWEQVANRCLACANCTMACPTCFCSTVEDVTDLSGDHAERWRSWDSCFTLDFSYIHGGNVRHSTLSRYRQWMTHKLSTWHDQFESSGCVGCGRCITWCPVGIDITEEVAAIRIPPPPSVNHEDEESPP
ncbi:4Fe-4S dicluster domain-containing protein [Nitrospina sp. 32_T5]|uniref:4Fe-4S dicluster domain-containing protein n=1 Tax=unclassified Nitrospina TaxID=2638683 RepID=UPI003F9E821B